MDRRSARRVLSPKTAVNISTFNVRSLNSPNDWTKQEIVGFCELYNIGVLAIQEHRQNAVGDFSNAALLYEKRRKRLAANPIPDRQDHLWRVPRRSGIHTE